MQAIGTTRSVAPARVLIAWECGSNLGHLARCQAVARALRARGHRVALATRELPAPSYRHDDSLYLQAPRPGVRAPRAHRPPANYAELLLIQGYSDPRALAQGLRSWMDLIALHRADFVLADYAPTAMLAARLSNVPGAAIGNGFAVPPPDSPWPAIRPDAPSTDPARLTESESTLDRNVAQAAALLGIATAPTVRALFGQNDLLDTFAELDHYGVRPEAHYVGPIFGIPDGLRVCWQNTSVPRICAYLRASVPGFGQLLDALRGSGAEVICVIPDLDPERARRLADRNLRISLRPVVFADLLPEMDLMIGYGGGATMCEALLAETPLLLMPLQVEHAMAAQRVEAIGAAQIIGPHRSTAALSALIRNAMASTELKAGARAFAARHKGYRSADAVSAVVAHIEAHVVSHRQPMSEVA